MSSDDVTRPAAAPLLKIGSRTVPLKKGETAKLTERELDLCFVFDTTGSMSDKIDGLVRCMDSLVGDLGRLALDWRVVTVPFGDLTVRGDRVVADQPFVCDVHAASKQLRSMPRFSGGGNTGESSVEAMLAGCQKSYRPQAVKVLVLITDEPALGHAQGAHAVDSAMRTLDAACFTVAPNLPYYRAWAEQHGGEWRQIGSDVDTSTIMRLFESLLAEIATVADSIYRVGRGSVQAYLEKGEGS
jgi:von Willebrand factor type A domain